MKKDVIFGVVRAVEHGPKGPFAIATSLDVRRSVTFSLKPPVWEETDHPIRGARVVLSDLREIDGGWRAETARYKQPSDEQGSN